MSSISKSEMVFAELRKLGYAFNEDGQLRKIDATTGQPGREPYQFDVFNDARKNQNHYEKLANELTEIVYDLLEQNGLSRTYIPEDVSPEKATFFFNQPKKLKKSKKLIVIIHGSGYVRAGQWSRRLIINESLDHGTQIPFIKRAQSLGYDIIVTNTNEYCKIPGLNSPKAHANYVWEKYVMGSQPETVAIVAHSYGGVIVCTLAERFPQFFKEKVFAIALTDSVHSKILTDIHKLLTDIACNWVSSDEPVDTFIENSSKDIKRVSAGHEQHEWASYSAFESIFKYLEVKYENYLTSQQSLKKVKLDV